MASQFRPFQLFRSLQGRDRVLAVGCVALVTVLFVTFYPAYALVYPFFVWIGMSVFMSVTGQDFSVDEAERRSGLPGYVPVLAAIGVLTSIFAVLVLFAPQILEALGGVLMAIILLYVIYGLLTR